MKIVNIILAAILSANSIAMASSKSVEATDIVGRYQDLGSMSKEEIQQGLVELGGALTLMKNDLAEAKQTAEGRKVSVKVRNVSVGVGAASLLAFMGFRAFHNPMQGAVSGIGTGLGIIVSLTVLAGATIVAVGAEGYILLTSDEVAQIESRIAQVEATIKKIQAKL